MRWAAAGLIAALLLLAGNRVPAGALAQAVSEPRVLLLSESLGRLEVEPV